MTSTLIAPCLECKERKVTTSFNCHDSCARYNEWRMKKIAEETKRVQRLHEIKQVDELLSKRRRRHWGA